MKYYLALLIALSLVGTESHAQLLRVFSYQFLIVDANSGLPIPDGDHAIVVNYYSSGIGGSAFLSETFPNIHPQNGIVNLILGTLMGHGGFPENINFRDPIWFEIILDPGASDQTTFPRQLISAFPYALNAESAIGIQVTTVPTDQSIFPLIMSNGKIDTSLLPLPRVLKVNSVGANGIGALTLQSDSSVQITTNKNNHSITLSKVNVLDTIIQPCGLLSGFGGGRMTVFICDGEVTNQSIATGAIDGSKLAPDLDGKAMVTGSIPPSKWAPNNGATMLAVGTTAQRPATPTTGTMRFNTTSGKFEGFDGTNWVNLN